jgi:hypothetical protein
MRSILTVILLALSIHLYAQEEALLQDAIKQPVQSQRCKELFHERSDKIKVQQRLNGLIKRNEVLLKNSPKNKETLVARLKSNQIKIRNELYLTNLRLESMEENIVRSGCPGLSL